MYYEKRWWFLGNLGYPKLERITELKIFEYPRLFQFPIPGITNNYEECCFILGRKIYLNFEYLTINHTKRIKTLVKSLFNLFKFPSKLVFKLTYLTILNPQTNIII